MLNFGLKGLPRLLLVVAIFFPLSHLQGQGKQTSSRTLKIGFLMDSLKVERWQTDLEKFQKRAAELGADVLVETAEGDDELQLQQAEKLLEARRGRSVGPVMWTPGTRSGIPKRNRSRSDP